MHVCVCENILLYGVITNIVAYWVYGGTSTGCGVQGGCGILGVVLLCVWCTVCDILGVVYWVWYYCVCGVLGVVYWAW